MDNEELDNIEINVTAPKGIEYETYLERINLDEEKKKDLESGKGFIVSEPDDDKKAIDNGIKDINSIYSSRFMKTIQDPDAYTDRYSCQCGKLQGKSNEGTVCPYCFTKVVFTDIDFDKTGYIDLKDEYPIIHPMLYLSLCKYIGKANFEAIIEPQIDLDENGNPVKVFSSKLAKSQLKRKATKTRVDNKYAGIGIIGFYEKFDEIMEYFHNKKKGKKEDYYESIMKDKDKVFIHSIPVFTTALRPFKIEGSSFTFEGTNQTYNIMAKQAAKLNDDSLSIYNIAKYRAVTAWRVQDYYNQLCQEIINICKGKKGVIRNLIGGRCNFTGRSIIVPGPKLRPDSVILPYHCLLELLQQTIINIMVKTYGISYNDAYMKFQEAQLKIDPRIKSIIQNIIDTSGVNVLINRNPTINYGSIIAMKCVGINDSYTMSMPLQVLKALAADFDGDCLNIVYIPNDEFWKDAMEIFNPANSMMISRNDGRFNSEYGWFKDMLINSNTLMYMGRDVYSSDQLSRIKDLQRKYAE